MFFDMDPTILAGLVGAGQNALSSVFGMIDGAVNRNFQRKEAEKNRDWQSEEAALQRDWSAAEAERARDWNEEMYEKYNSMSGKIAQAEQAGVNPMFAITGNAVSPVSANASAPGGASAGSVGTPSGMSSSARGLIDIMANITGIKRQQSEAEVNSALAQKYLAEAEGQKITNETLHEMNVTEILQRRSEIQYNEENTKLVTSKILNTDADTEVKFNQIAQIGSTIANMNADTEVKRQQIGVMLSEIYLNSKSLEVMESQLLSMFSDRQKAQVEINNLQQQWHILREQCTHEQIEHGFRELAMGREVGKDNWYNSQFLPPIKRTIDSLLGWWSGSVSVVKHK